MKTRLIQSGSKKHGVTIRLPFRKLGMDRQGTVQAFQDAIRNRAARDAYRREEAKGTIQHVKDGKPLTEHGAKLLGVAWPISEP